MEDGRRVNAGKLEGDERGCWCACWWASVCVCGRPWHFLPIFLGKLSTLGLCVCVWWWLVAKNSSSSSKIIYPVSKCVDGSIAWRWKLDESEYHSDQGIKLPTAEDQTQNMADFLVDQRTRNRKWQFDRSYFSSWCTSKAHTQIDTLVSNAKKWKYLYSHQCWYGNSRNESLWQKLKLKVQNSFFHWQFCTLLTLCSSNHSSSESAHELCDSKYRLLVRSDTFPLLSSLFFSFTSPQNKSGVHLCFLPSTFAFLISFSFWLSPPLFNHNLAEESLLLSSKVVKRIQAKFPTDRHRLKVCAQINFWVFFLNTPGPFHFAFFVLVSSSLPVYQFVSFLLLFFALFLKLLF